MLLYGLVAHGEDFVKRINGFFAFAFYDSTTQEVLLGRDRLGIKPLYFSLSEKGLRFSSELKPLKKLGVPFSINAQALHEYLLYSYVPEPLCLVDGVTKLAPGSMLGIQLRLGLLKRAIIPLASSNQHRGLLS